MKKHFQKYVKTVRQKLDREIRNAVLTLCKYFQWQAAENVAGDSDPLHWDHAVILTGLDVHVLDRDMKVSSQVVGLAPVSGMCTPASSCTVNEGRHFESVYVMAHEIGHK